MKKRNQKYNSKRTIRKDISSVDLTALAKKVRYTGNPEHKRNPGDFNLTPPVLPRATKTLCDEVAIFSKAKASKLLREGVKRGLISEQTHNGFPQNIWSVTKDGRPLEAQLENRETGEYHGYPLPAADPFGKIVLGVWQ